MQNFTFGRKGTNWFLFAFVLLIGTLPSFGQEDCPSLGNSNPADFCYLDDINDLTDATNPNDDVVWYRNEALTEPVPSNELLEDGLTYWAGNPDGDCTNPEAVTVTVETIDAPISEYGNVYSPYLESEDATRNIGDLIEAINIAGDGDEIVVYETEFGTDSYNETDLLTDGQSYFVGQTETGNECYSLRLAIRYSPDVAPAPNAESPQVFCEGATVADLEATGTSEDTQAFRWYSTATSNPALDENEELRSGTYYVSQIVNDEGLPFPPTESEDRTAVTVEIIQFDAGEDVSTTLCLAEVQERLAAGEAPQSLFLTLVEDRNLPSNVTFNPSIQSIAADFNEDPTQTFTTEATFTNEEGCQDTVELSITVEESFEPGDDNTGNTLCRSQIGGTASATQVENYLLGLLSDDADQDGEFSPSPSEIADDLNDTSDEITFDITYTVGEGTSCEDSAILEVTVFEGADYQIVQPEPLCNDDIPALVNEIPEDVEALFLENFDGATPNGEFEEGTIQAVIDQYNQNNIGTFNATFIAQTEDGCSEPIELERTVIEGETANAGTFDNIEDVCSNDDTIDLTSLTNNDTDATQGGTFSGDGVSNNIFDPSLVEPGNITITYTVDESIDCVEGNEDTTFLIEVIQGPDAGNDIEDSICLSEVIAIAEDFDIADPDATLTQLFQRFDWDGDIDGEFSPSATSLGLQLVQYFGNEERDPELLLNGTYTVGDPAEECGTDVSSFAITIIDGELLDAGADNTDNTLCNADIPGLVNSVPDDVEDLYFDLLEDGVPQNGTFSPSIEEIIADYNSDNFQTFSTTYTIGTDGCSSSVNLAITVVDEQEAIAESTDDEINVCSSETSYDLTTALSTETTPGGTFFLNDEEFDGTTFDASNVEEGPYEFTYTVSSEDADCIDGSATTDFTINVTSDFDFGNVITDILCESEVPANLTADIIEDYYLGLVSGLPSGGSFSKEPEEILAEYNEDPTNTFTTVYSVESGDCEGSVTVSVTVQEEGDANAGEIDDQVVCTTDGMIDLEQYLVGSGAQMGGTFSGEGVEEGMFNASMEADEYEITYTVTDAAPCVNEGTDDEEIFIISIIEPGQAIAEAVDTEIDVCTSETSYNLNNALSDDSTPGGTFFLDGEEFNGNTFDATSLETGEYSFTYTVSSEDSECIEGSATTDFTINVTSETFDAGDDVTFTVCSVGLDPTPTLTEVRNYFLNLLEDGIPQNGTFSPRMEEIREAYTAEQIGTFTSTYTVGNGTCADSVELTVVVTDAIEAEVGEIAPQTVCSSDEDIDLFSYLTDDTTTGGTFEGYEDGIFNPSMVGAGSYDVTYTVNEDAPCVEGEASTTFTITVEQGANAGEDMAVTVCSNDGQQDLYDLISADADMDGEFTLDGEVVVDGIMDPAAFEVGTYEVIYTVTAEGDECGGDDMSTITITLGEAPDAPTTGEAIAFCAIDGETAARLEADGTNLTWYSDADLTMMVSEEDLLVDGDYYVTQSSDEGCESEAAVLTVNIVDSPAPTISSNYKLCEFDNPTIAALTAEINESGEVTWYDSADSMTALSNNATLTDGTTYYATLISDNGCESSERLAVTVTLDECPLLFPEAITPNGDTRNDRFVIENIESEYPNYNITIFNRWGNAVYKGNASTPTWDGTSNQSGSFGDDVLPVGVYFYVVDFNDGSTEPRQGKVYLNR
jgi:gliding motility-associated-like protein